MLFYVVSSHRVREEVAGCGLNGSMKRVGTENTATRQGVDWLGVERAECPPNRSIGERARVIGLPTKHSLTTLHQHVVESPICGDNRSAFPVKGL